METPIAHPDSPSVVKSTRAKPTYVSGWHSTKLHLALITMAVIWVSWLILLFRTGSASLDILVMGELGAAGIYSTTNVAATLMSRNQTPPQTSGAPPTGGTSP